MTAFDFTDQVVLVTGSGSGIGFATARKFLEAGARVMLNGSRQERLDAALERLADLRTRATAFRADVRNKPEVEAMFASLLDRWGRIDVLVNSAGVWPYARVADMSEEMWDQTLDINLKGAFLTCQQAARQMMAQGSGKMVNIASGNWKVARVGTAAYGASKAGMVMLTSVLAQELGPHHINVNCVAPGRVEVESRVMTPEQIARRDNTDRQTPWGRGGQPPEIANAVLFLCSPEAEYITGAVLAVDGGLSLGRYLDPGAK